MRLNTPFPTAEELEADALAWRARRTQRRRYPELERLIVAAASNAALARQLIAAPETVVHTVSHICALSDDERALVCSITGAADIHEFAGRLHAALQHPYAASVAPAPEPTLLRQESRAALLAEPPLVG